MSGDAVVETALVAELVRRRAGDPLDVLTPHLARRGVGGNQTKPSFTPIPGTVPATRP